MIASFLIFAAVTYESQPKIPWGGTDFVQYYATARLLQQGQNPYDLALSTQIQERLGRDSGLPTYGPPWCLLPAFLLGYLSFPDAVAVNLGINVILLLVCTLAWTNLLFPEKKWLFPLMAVAIPIWLPIWLVLGLGQNSFWPLAGFTGWLWFTRRGCYLPAGACLSLLVIKPHLGLLLGLFAAAFMLKQHQWRSIFAFLLTLALATMVSLLIRPSVWSDYLIALRSGAPPMQYLGATLDGWLRSHGGDGLRYITWGVWGIGLLIGVWLGWKAANRQKDKEGKGQAYGEKLNSIPLYPSPLVSLSALLCIATLAIVPHAYSYDYVFMIPGFILALGSWIVWRERVMFLALIGWLLLVVFYSTGKGQALKEQNFFVIPWGALALTMMFTTHQRRPFAIKEPL